MRHLSVGYDEPLRSELVAFVDAVGTGMPPVVTGEQGVASLEVAIRCLAGATKTGLAVPANRRRVAGRSA